MIGAPGADSQGASTGAAYVVFGPISGSHSLSDADVQLLGETSLSYAGRGVDAAGDANGDGAADLVVGAPGDSTLATNAGASYIVFGPETGTLSLQNTTAKILGVGLGHSVGWAVAGGGDFDSDGLSDLLIAGHKEDSVGAESGAVFVLLGSRW